MSITVCVSASSTDGACAYTSELRSLLSSTSTADDAYQQQCLVVASRWAESYLRYPLLSQVYSETVAGYGTQVLMLSRTPLRAVLRIFDSTTTCSANVYTSSQYRVDAEPGFLKLTDGSAFPWSAMTRYSAGPYVPPGSELETWLVEYQAGYVWPGTSSTAYGTSSTGPSMPEDLRYGVLLYAADVYQQDMDVANQKIGDLAISYKSETMGTGDARSMAERSLGPYRRGF